MLSSLYSFCKSNVSLLHLLCSCLPRVIDVICHVRFKCVVEWNVQYPSFWSSLPVKYWVKAIQYFANHYWAMKDFALGKPVGNVNHLPKNGTNMDTRLTLLVKYYCFCTWNVDCLSISMTCSVSYSMHLLIPILKAGCCTCQSDKGGLMHTLSEASSTLNITACLWLMTCSKQILEPLRWLPPTGISAMMKSQR